MEIRAYRQRLVYIVKEKRARGSDKAIAFVIMIAK